MEPYFVRCPAGSPYLFQAARAPYVVVDAPYADAEAETQGFNLAVVECGRCGSSLALLHSVPLPDAQMVPWREAVGHFLAFHGACGCIPYRRCVAVTLDVRRLA